MKLTKVLSLLLPCLLLCGCGEVVPTPTPEATVSPRIVYGAAPAPETPSDDTPSGDADWKQAYAEYLPEHTSDKSPRRFVLIYLDDDGIPEIADIGDCEAEGSRILNYSNGAVHETQLNRLSFSYIPRGNLLLNNEGNMGHYIATVYSVIDGEMTAISGGTQDQTGEQAEFDENGEIKYNYTWNGASATAEEYEAALAAVFDASLAVYSYDLYDPIADYEGLYTAEEIIEQLGDM